MREIRKGPGAAEEAGSPGHTGPGVPCGGRRRIGDGVDAGSGRPGESSARPVSCRDASPRGRADLQRVREHRAGRCAGSRGPARGRHPGGGRREPGRHGRHGRDDGRRARRRPRPPPRRKSGLGSAYRAGFRWGLDHGYEACVEMDADFSHDPGALPRPGGARSRRATSWSIGSRYVPGGPSPTGPGTVTCSRWGGNRYASAVARARAWPTRPPASGPTRPSVLRRLDLDRIRAEGYGFQIEMTYRAKQAGAPVDRGADPFRRPGGRRVQDVDGRSWSRRWAW